MPDFFVASSDPAEESEVDSSVIRAEFAAIATAFGKLASYTGNGSKVLFVNSGGTGYEALAAAAACSALGVGTEDSPTFTGLTLTGALSVAGLTTMAKGMTAAFTANILNGTPTTVATLTAGSDGCYWFYYGSNTNDNKVLGAVITTAGVYRVVELDNSNPGQLSIAMSGDTLQITQTTGGTLAFRGSVWKQASS